jgi:hypothetical protein
LAHEGGKVVSPTHWLLLSSRKCFWYLFLLEVEFTPRGHSAVGKIMSMKNSNDTIWNRTSGFPTCSAVPQPTASSRVPLKISKVIICMGSKNVIFQWIKNYQWIDLLLIFYLVYINYYIQLKFMLLNLVKNKLKVIL